tara:strand:+ start:30 stop:533 length:504 start_codon:yes stop_codon:yes gene_type:complete
MRVLLKLLKETDVDKNYIDWFSDEEVVRFSDNQYGKFDMSNEKEYVKNCIINTDIDLYGIFVENKLVGNISIKGIKSLHKRAEISYLIGDKKFWNKGIASTAIKEIVKKATNHYKLNKLFAGVAEENIKSIKILEKNNFVLEGKRLNHLYYNGKYYNQLDYGLIIKK